jgi:hypothetical protein
MDRTNEANHTFGRSSGILRKASDLSRGTSRSSQNFRVMGMTPGETLVETLENTRRLHLYTRETIRNQMKSAD